MPDPSDPRTTRADGERCPRCGAPTVPVLVGRPTPEAMEAAKRGELVLAGCAPGPGVADRACPRCRPLFVDE